MRAPTPLSAQYAWHRAALARQPGNDHLDRPQCGWFRYRMVRGGPWVAARIYVEQEIDADTGELLADERLRCEVNGEPADRVIDRVWIWAEPITEGEFDYLTALRRHAAWHDPRHPAANPRRALNPLTDPVPF